MHVKVCCTGRMSIDSPVHVLLLVLETLVIWLQGPIDVDVGCAALG